MTTHLTLSEAIQLGSMLKPQGFGAFRDPRTGATCVLGAAAEAGGIVVTTHWTPLAQLWPLVLRTGACPACGAGGDPNEQYGYLMYHLNDEHRWTRERIAAWVQSLEASQPAAVIASPVEAPAR